MHAFSSMSQCPGTRTKDSQPWHCMCWSAYFNVHMLKKINFRWTGHRSHAEKVGYHCSWPMDNKPSLMTSRAHVHHMALCGLIDYYMWSTWFLLSKVCAVKWSEVITATLEACSSWNNLFGSVYSLSSVSCSSLVSLSVPAANFWRTST